MNVRNEAMSQRLPARLSRSEADQHSRLVTAWLITTTLTFLLFGTRAFADRAAPITAETLTFTPTISGLNVSFSAEACASSATFFIASGGTGVDPRGYVDWVNSLYENSACPNPFDMTGQADGDYYMFTTVPDNSPNPGGSHVRYVGQFTKIGSTIVPSPFQWRQTMQTGALHPQYGDYIGKQAGKDSLILI